MGHLYSQEWRAYLPQKEESQFTFYDYQNAFYSYWDQYEIIDGFFINDKGEKQKAGGFKQFKRWEYFWESRIDRETGAFPRLEARKLRDKFQGAKQNINRSAGADSWSVLGPNSSGGGYAGVGRINCTAFHPADNNTFWVGTAAGGIWKTIDAGTTWTVLNNGTPVLAVSDIIIPSDYSSSNTIYIATGDRDGWDNNSIGVLKSTDGGSTWNSTDLSYSVANSKMVSRLLVDPQDDQTIIAATKNGVYKTTDGGDNWDTQLTSERFTDLEYEPGDFNTLYGGTRYGGEVWTSTDGGSNWTNPLNTAGTRVEIEVSADDPSIVYALISASNNGLLGVYKSTDSGVSFTLAFDGSLANQNLLGWDSDGGDSGGQGWYDLSFDVNPDDADMVFVGGVNTWRSIDGASSFSIVNHWYGGGGVSAVHADKHKLQYRANGDLFECNDGGVYISADDGGSWTDLTDGMTISQIYKIGVAQTAANDVITGLQDNGSKSYENGVWDDVIGGDGMDCAIDYSDEQTQYGELYYGDLKRTTNHWSNYTSIKPSGSSGSWVTPFVLDPVDNETIYAGYQNIYKSVDRGNNWTSIYDLDSGNKFRTLAVAPSNTQVIYAGEPYSLWKTTNGGTNWTEITNGLPGSFITSIAVDHDTDNHLWVSLSTYSGNSVYESTDGGASWINISTGLPDVPVHCVIHNKQTTSQNDLFAATDNGVYFKGGSGNWISYNTGLPNVVVREVEIYYDLIDRTNSLIRAGSYGRGLWESPIYEPIPEDPDQSRDLVFSDVTFEEINVNWTNGNATNRIVKISDMASFSVPVDGTDPVANTVFGGGEQVIYNGPGAFVTVTGLDPGNTYYFRVFDYEGNGTNTVYNMAPGINNPDQCQTFCMPSTNTIDDDYIARFVLNSIDNTSGETEYTDFTAMSTDLIPDNSYDVSVEVGGYNEYLSIWLDWNDNQIFENEEKLVDDFVCVKNALSTTSFLLPASVDLGAHRLRARVSYNSGAGSCGAVSYGEAEDYTVHCIKNITWTGTISDDWFEPGNWDGGIVPTSNYAVTIPNEINQPLIGIGTTGYAKKITSETGASLIIEGELILD